MLTIYCDYTYWQVEQIGLNAQNTETESSKLNYENVRAEYSQ